MEERGNRERLMKAIARSNDVRRQNQRRILAALRSRGSLSRTELKIETGLSAATITAIVNDLLESGYLIEAEKADDEDPHISSGLESKRGRPQVSLEPNPQIATVATVILTFNRISAALIDYSGRVVTEVSERIAVKHLKRKETVSRLVALLDQALAKMHGGPQQLKLITIAVQGVTDVDGRCMKWSPITPHRDLQLADELEARFGAQVSVTNDTTMIAAALRAMEPARIGNSFAAILLSHGIGMGLYLNGAPFAGIRSSAVEFGHMCHVPKGALCRCGRRGCIEAYAGDYGIWRMATGGDPHVMPAKEIDLEMMSELATHAHSGDEQAAGAYRAAGAAIGHGLRNMFALMDPFPVVFVGSGAMAFDLMEPEIEKSLGRENVGLSHANIEISCRLDDLDLTRKGTIVTALAALDSSIQITREPAGWKNEIAN